MTPWQRARRLFPGAARLSHLDHAGGGPISSRVDEAVRAWSDAVLQGGGRADVEGEVARVRGRVAALLGAQASEVAFVPGAAAGLEAVAANVAWRRGDRLALLGPVPESPWRGIDALGVERVRLPAAPTRAAQAALDAALHHPRTRMLVVPAVDPTSGARTPLLRIGRACRERAVLFCVDASHALGCLALDVAAAGADYLVSDGHRFLLSLPGCGILVRRAGLAAGGTSAGARFEKAPAPPLGVAALGAAVDLLLELGPEAIEERVLALNQRLRRGLETLRCEVASPDADCASGILCFRLGEEPPVRTRERLEARGVRVAATALGVRASPHFYIEPTEIDALLAAL